MRFTVRGADPATGMDVAMPIEAASAAEAEALANAKGLFVIGIEPAAGQVELQGRHTSVGRSTGVGAVGRDEHKGWMQRLAAFPYCRHLVTAAAAVLVLVPLLIWWINVKGRIFMADQRGRSVGEPAASTGGSSRSVTPAVAPAQLPRDPGAAVKNSSPAPWELGHAIVNSVGMRLTYIPPGEFVTQSEADMAPILRRPAVPKRVGKGFLIGTTEVTQGQWRAVMGTTPWSGRENVAAGDDCPASYVRWEDAVAFYQKLSEKEGRKYRLPTQVEWAYACRAGTKTMFSFGGYSDRNRLGDYGSYDGNAGSTQEKTPRRAGLKMPNPWGVYDTHGNVSEWCADLHKPGGTGHVFCGGSWLDDAGGCTSDSVLHHFDGDCPSAGSRLSA